MENQKNVSLGKIICKIDCHLFESAPGITFRSQAFTVSGSQLIGTMSCGLLAPAQKLTVRNVGFRVAKVTQNIEHKEDHEVYKFDRWLITDSLGFTYPYGMGPDGSTVVACNGRSEWRASR